MMQIIGAALVFLVYYLGIKILQWVFKESGQGYHVRITKLTLYGGWAIIMIPVFLVILTASH